MTLRLRTLLLYALFLFIIRPALAQDTYAAVLHVNYKGVEIQRAGTSAWLPLPVGAVAPFGSGDQLRTDETGRAALTFWEGAQMLVLSRSTYRLDTLEIMDGAGRQLSGELTGLAVHQFEQLPEHLTYALTLQEAVITQPGARYATWSRTEEPLSAISADGTLTLTLSDTEDTFTVEAGAGFLRDKGPGHVLSFDAPWNAAKLQGLIEGCPGMVETIGEVLLRVRQGPGLGYANTGAFDYAQSVQIMAVNESGGWYRIAFLSGFGWILRTATETDCENLPVLPDNTLEIAEYIINLNTDEIELLRPFFGSPAVNGWFYRWEDTTE